MVVIYMLLLVWHNNLDPGVKPRDDIREIIRHNNEVIQRNDKRTINKRTLFQLLSP